MIKISQNGLKLYNVNTVYKKGKNITLRNCCILNDDKKFSYYVMLLCKLNVY